MASKVKSSTQKKTQTKRTKRTHYTMYALKEFPKKCAHCSGVESKVIKTVEREGTKNVTRRRECLGCGKTFSTIVWGAEGCLN